MAKVPVLKVLYKGVVLKRQSARAYKFVVVIKGMAPGAVRAKMEQWAKGYAAEIVKYEAAVAAGGSAEKLVGFGKYVPVPLSEVPAELMAEAAKKGSAYGDGGIGEKINVHLPAFYEKCLASVRASLAQYSPEKIAAAEAEAVGAPFSAYGWSGSANSAAKMAKEAADRGHVVVEVFPVPEGSAS